jgi:hypothetical protein
MIRWIREVGSRETEVGSGKYEVGRRESEEVVGLSKNVVVV